MYIISTCTFKTIRCTTVLGGAIGPYALLPHLQHECTPKIVVAAVTILLLTTVLLAEKRKLIGLPSGKGEHMLKEDQMLKKDIAIYR